MVIREVIHKGHRLELHHTGLWSCNEATTRFDSLKNMKLYLREYRYEWVAYTDNLNYGRVKIAQDRDKNWVRHMAEKSGKGCYVIKRVRVSIFE